MKLQSLESLFPDVTFTGDRGVYLVRSRSGEEPRRVDKEKRMTLGECDCPAFQKARDKWCYHIQRVDRYVSSMKTRDGMMSALGE